MKAVTFTRRRALQFLAAAGAASLAGCSARARTESAPADASSAWVTNLRALEQASGGRLGVFVLDTGSGRELGWRADERFALCSTFKLLLAGMVLEDVDAGRLDPAAPIGFSMDDLVPYAPVIQARLDAGIHAMTAVELAQATQVTSDNVAANLLLRELGGPAAITARLRGCGDTVTRLDRIEPELNLVPPGEIRDTTSPRAMAHTTARYVVGDRLQEASRRVLADWMVETRTGLRRLRAGFPEAWLAGDKTGTGIAPAMANKHNDVAVAWPPGRAPIVVACYFEADGHHSAARAEDDAVLAQVGGIVGRWVG